MSNKEVNKKLQSSLAFRYIWILWGLAGMYPTKKYRLPFLIYSTIPLFIVGTLLPISIFIHCFQIRDLKELVTSIFVNVAVVVASIKLFSIYGSQEQLFNSSKLLENVDKRSDTHKGGRQHILQCIRLSHIINFAYLVLYMIVTIGFLTVGLIWHQTAYPAYFPEFFDDPEKNFYTMFFYQNISVAVFVLFMNVANDTYPQCYVAIMIGHLRALSERVQEIGKDKKLSVDENYKELLACINDHYDILDYFGCVQPMISRTIFVQILVTAFVLCLIAINIIFYPMELAQIVFTLFYGTAILMELFPICWFMNSLVEVSGLLTVSIYSCNWYDQDERFKKTLLFFLHRTQKIRIIMAGQLFPVSLQTFMQVIRFTFSMFTVFTRLGS